MINKLLIIEKRLSKIEKLLNERSVNRTGEKSNAFLIWQFLMDNGPSLPFSIKNSFPEEKRSSVASTLAKCVKDNCIIKQGQRYVANPDYVWDDVGNLNNAISSKDIKEDPIQEPEVSQEEPIQEPTQTTPVVKQPVKYTPANFINVIIKTLKTSKSKSDFLEQLELGFNALDVLDELPRKKQDSIAAEFNSNYGKFRRAIVTFGVDKFTKRLKDELKRKGVRVVRYNPHDDDDDKWDDYSGGDGYNNKSFDYYNDDDLRW